MSTKEKILAEALALFNERGTDVVTVRHIAQAAGMSHGNLCYHYPNTDAIVQSLYNQLVGHINEQITAVATPGFELIAAGQLVAHAMEALYRYRFLLLDFAGIMRRIPAIRDQHQALLKQRGLVFRQLLAYLREAGLMKPELYAGHDEHLLTQLFIVGDFWIASAEWLYEGEAADKLPYYQQVLTALLVPLLTEQGWKQWHEAAEQSRESQT
ncbi:TetR/AcrR family transcriptional regulator [Hymenobacter terrenus]|uniref:TetR/AcrR family transcriptional regulator n=1 Tax=Hymenobacter terrenus TaxID=1629124 RepID=UPI0006196326|nr:TetR/AcrR family transcriptional regulator [Hymenobacter terrenus]